MSKKLIWTVRTDDLDQQANAARCVLGLLGFGGVIQFAYEAGISHTTAGRILGTIVQTCKSRPTAIIKVNECLNTAFLDKKDDLQDFEKKFILEWVKRWQAGLEKSILRMDAPGKLRYADFQHAKDRKRKTKRAIEAFRHAIKTTKWGSA